MLALYLATTAILPENKSVIMSDLLEINKTVSNPTPLTGEEFSYVLNYSCASLVEDCLGVMITDTLPSSVEFVRVTGSTHTFNEQYDPLSHTVTFEFVDPFQSGSSGQVVIDVRFPNGITPNGTLAENTAIISGSNSNSDTSMVVATAVAMAQPEPNLNLINGGAVGGNTTYSLSICNNFGVENGLLDFENLVIVDTLPPGTVLIQVNPQGSSYTYDPVSHTITFTRPLLRHGECTFPRVTVSFPSPPYSVGDNIETHAHYCFDAIGEVRDTIVDTLFHILTDLVPAGTTIKTVSKTDVFPGETGMYRIRAEADGTEALENFCVHDTIPQGIEVSEFTTGGFFYGGLRENEFRNNVYVTTNLNGPYLVPGSPFSIFRPIPIVNTITDLGLTPGVEYITSISFCFGDVPAGFSNFEPIMIDFEVMDNAVPGIVSNCAELSSTTAGALLEVDCVDLNILPKSIGINLAPDKTIENNQTFNRGETINFQLGVNNGVGASDSILNPVVYDLLPDGVTYVPGSWTIPAISNPSNFPPPSFIHITNYKGTGRDFLKWEWQGANSIKIPANEGLIIQFSGHISDNALGGFPAFHNRFYIESSNNIVNCLGQEEPDIYDFDDDGDELENLCGDNIAVNINEIVSLESEKLVIGQLDSAFTMFPETANTVPGGVADYRLVIRNTGNIQLDSIVIIDILPFPGLSLIHI